MTRSRSLVVLLLAAGCGASGGSPDAATPPPATDAAVALADAPVVSAPDARTLPPDAADAADLADAADAAADAPPAPSDAAPDAPPPPPTAAPIVSACGGTNKVTLFAAPVTGAVSYRVYYGTTPGVSKSNGTEHDASSLPVVLTTGILSDGTTYHFVMTAVDAHGQESAMSNEATATPLTRIQDTAFLADTVYNNADPTITILECFSLFELGEVPSTEAAAVTRTIGSPASQLGVDTFGVSVAPADRLLFATTFEGNAGDGELLVWEDADTVNIANDAPSVMVAGLHHPGGIVADVQHHRLYVGDGANEAFYAAIHIYKLPLDGTEYGTIKSSALHGPFQLFLDDADDELYVANYNSTLVFKDVSTISGTSDIAPARTLTVANENNRGVWLDKERDLLYLSDDAAYVVYRVAHGSTADGALSPVILDTTGISVEVIDDALYTNLGGIKVFLNASALSGSVTPDYSVGHSGVQSFLVIP